MRTPLYERHCALGAKIVDFNGWEMPIQYKGILHEHHTVRKAVGLFDVSHMGRIAIEGPDAESLLDYLSTNQITDRKVGTATYTVWCDENGKCIDDLIIYRETPLRFFVVVNAGNRQKDLDHLKFYAQGKNLMVADHYRSDGILAVQGPLSRDLLSKLFSEVSTLTAMHLTSVNYQNQSVIVSQTGYTGEEGFEIFAKQDVIVLLWDRLLEEGQSFGIEPIGLGARDTLRMEMGYALYGHEISGEILPNESVSAWTIKWQKKEFLGKTALEMLESSSNKRFEYGIVLQDKGIAREGYPIFHQGAMIGKVTSGTLSPSLNQAVAIVLVERNLKEGDSVEVQIRQNKCMAKVVRLPFYRKSRS